MCTGRGWRAVGAGSWNQTVGQLISSHQPTAQLTPALEVVGFLWGIRNAVLCRVLQSYVNTSQGSPQSDSAGAKSCSSGCVSLDFCLRRWSMGEPREAGPCLPPRAGCGAATPWVHGKRGLVVLRNRWQHVRVLCLPGSCQLQHLGVMKHSLSSFLLTPPPLLMTPFPVCAINLKAPYYSVLSFYKLHIFLVSLLYES